MNILSREWGTPEWVLTLSLLIVCVCTMCLWKYASVRTWKPEINAECRCQLLFSLVFGTETLAMSAAPRFTRLNDKGLPISTSSAMAL